VLDFKIVKIIPLVISTTQQLKNFELEPQTPKNQKKKQKNGLTSFVELWKWLVGHLRIYLVPDFATRLSGEDP
jgi:hypothetical protein